MFCGDIWINNGDKRSQWVNWRPVVIWSSLTLVKEFFLGGGIPILIKVDGFQLTRSIGSELFHSDKPIQALQLEEMKDSILSAAFLSGSIPILHCYSWTTWAWSTFQICAFNHFGFTRGGKIYICPTHEALTSTANLNQIEKCNKTDLSWGKLHMWHEIISGCEKPVSVSLTHWIRYLDLTKPRIYLHWPST